MPPAVKNLSLSASSNASEEIYPPPLRQNKAPLKNKVPNKIIYAVCVHISIKLLIIKYNSTMSGY